MLGFSLEIGAHRRAIIYAYPLPEIEVYASEAPYVPEGLVTQLARALLHPPVPIGPEGYASREPMPMGAVAVPAGWIIRYAEREHLITQSGYEAALRDLPYEHRQSISEWLSRARRLCVLVAQDGTTMSLWKYGELSGEERARIVGYRWQWRHPRLFLYGAPTHYGLSFMWLAARLFPEYSSDRPVRRAA